ncbi:MAG: AAA family ATPase [Actinomycetota bacterium]|nr:AAA family ATPase [Actinomycetota bacterium]
MRDDEIRTRLRENNPWWQAAAAAQDPVAWASDDRSLVARKSFDLGYRSNLLNDVANGDLDNKLIVLRGPRRVGKSVLLKDTALSLCRRSDIDPRQLIYVAFDGMTLADLRRAIRLGRELTRSMGELRQIWLLDEVTAVKGWTTELKYQRDNTPFGNDTVVCTGSSWDDSSNVMRDLMAGRSGERSNRRSRILHPMSLREVLIATMRLNPAFEKVRPWELQSPDSLRIVENLEPFVDALDLAWQSYLTSGGFPRAVAENHHAGAVSDSFLEDLASWLHRDVDPDAHADSVPRLLSTIEQHCSSPLSRKTLAEELGYADGNSFDIRLNRLTHTYAALWCHQIDVDGDRKRGSQSKMYLTDPLLSWIGPRLRSGIPSPDFTRLTEAALAVSIARAVDDLQSGRWESNDAIGYLRTGGGKEIDFSKVPIPSTSGVKQSVPIEAKWVSSRWRSEAKSIEGYFSSGVVATRTILDTSYPVWAIPAPIVALLLE